MSASSSALQLGLLPWRLKRRQETVWSEKPTNIEEIGDFYTEIELALPALADRITRPQRSALNKLLKLMEETHRLIADQNMDRYMALMGITDRRQRLAKYREYLTEDTNQILRECQERDRTQLRELLAAIVRGDKRLQGYFQVGDRLGETRNVIKRATGPLSAKERAYVLAGMKKLPLREQREIERECLPPSLRLFALAKGIQKLGRFLERHEDELVAKPHWDGRTITYREDSQEIKIQAKGVIVIILDEAEKHKWADSFKLPASLLKNPKSIANALGHFHRQHKIVEFSLNKDRLIWGPPGTVLEEARGIAKMKSRREGT